MSPLDVLPFCTEIFWNRTVLLNFKFQALSNKLNMTASNYLSQIAADIPGIPASVISGPNPTDSKTKAFFRVHCAHSGPHPSRPN